MAGLLTNDQALVDNIVGLLDFDALSTPTTGSAALSNAQTADGSSSSGASGDDDAKTDKRKVRREKEKVRQRRYRQRLRDDRDDLQSQVDELTEQLDALKQAAERRKKKAESQLACSQAMKKARLQRSKRQQSEAQQKQLVAATNYQAEYIKTLRKMYNARVGGAKSSLYTVPGVLHSTYLQQLDGCFARVDTVMNACGVVSLPETTLYSVSKRESDGAVTSSSK